MKREEELTVSVKAALRAYAEASKGEKCPICAGTESCDHTVKERLSASLARPQSAAVRDEAHEPEAWVCECGGDKSRYDFDPYGCHCETERMQEDRLFDDILSALNDPEISKYPDFTTSVKTAIDITKAYRDLAKAVRDDDLIDIIKRMIDNPATMVTDFHEGRATVKITFDTHDGAWSFIHAAGDARRALQSTQEG